jgi:hypothetical protein
MIRQFFWFGASMSVAFFSLFCGNNNTSLNQSLTTQKEDSAVLPTGAIAYIRNGSEIRLIDSNGRNDRQIWTHPDAKEPLGIHHIAWRPDGKELAISSAHEAIYSLYEADIYAIHPDGSGFRKITNTPAHKDLGKYKKGSVTITVRNNQYSFQQAQSSAGVFFISIAGAEEPQQVSIPPGASKTIVLKSVADYGAHAQPIVAIYGNYRWFMPGTDVEAGRNVKAPDMIISGDGIEHFGAFRPVWKQDGSEISYRNGVCIVQTIPSHPPEGDVSYHPMFSDKNPMGSCVWDLGPTPALADQVIYSENSSDEGSGIYLTKEGSAHNPATRLTLFSDIQYQLLNDLRWLPDGSGFLYSTVNLYRDAANIFWFDMKTKQKKQVTPLQGAFARQFCISPDGRWIVYERAKTTDDDAPVDLWMVHLDGTGDHLLVKNGRSPTWSK